MSFMLNPDAMILARYNDVPNKILSYVGSVSHMEILDVGCGAMHTDFKLLEMGAKHVTGYDIIPVRENYLDEVAADLTKSGLKLPDHKGRLTYTCYDGTHFPADDESFQIVYSWGVFEHIADPLAVLREMRRVLRWNGACFICVYPWWPSYYGSHLTDYIDEPFFHLNRPDEWVKEALDKYSKAHPAEADLVSRHMWGEYQSLNKISVDDFYAMALEAGWIVTKCELLSYAQDLRNAPRGRRFTELMACGATFSLRKQI